MKVDYKGHEIDVHRDRACGGWMSIYYSIFRKSDLFECASGFSTGSDRICDFMRYMKQRVDAELAEDDPWGEKGDPHS